MARLSGVAVLLLVVVPLCMYTCALFVGIQLGRALERRPAHSISISIRGVVDYFAKELWDIERGWVSVGRESLGERPVRFVDHRVGTGSPMQPKRTYIRPVVDPESGAVLKELRSIEGRSGNLGGGGGDGALFSVPSSRSDGTVETKYIQYNQRPVVDQDSSATKIRSHNRNHTAPRGVLSVGPWGGSGGKPFYMHGRSPPQVRSIVLYHSAGAIHSLACEYSRAGDDGSVSRVSGPWGLPNSFGSRAVRAVINLSAGEHVTAVEGSIGRFGNVPDVVITSLTFRSSIGRTYGPFGYKEGSSGSTRFSIPVAAGGCVAGFWGRSGWLPDAVGVYISPCPSPSGAQVRQGWSK